MNERISVVLATCNGAEYLAELLDSLAAQTLQPAELVVGDDCSTDGTLEILRTFAERSPFPVSVTERSARLGYADNFLGTAALARGSLIAFCDQDDIWDPRKLEIVAAAFVSHPDAVLVAHHATVVDRHGRSLGRTFPADQLAGLRSPGNLPPKQYPGFAITIRRELLEVADPDRRPDFGDRKAGRMGHDAWLWMLASCSGTSVILRDRLVSYRQHHNLFGDAHVGVAGLLRRTRAAGTGTYLAQAAGDELLAEYLESLSSEWVGKCRLEWAMHASNKAAWHRARAGFASHRATLYACSSRRVALRHWASMVRTGEYRRQDGRAVVSATKDVLRLIVPALKVAGRSASYPR